MQIILVVEDDLEQQSRVKKALAETGLRAVVVTSLEDGLRLLEQLQEKLAGVITDLHLPEKAGGDATKPCGLAMVAKAVQKQLPVVVCSDVNHHYAQYLNIVVETFALQHPLKEIPFVQDSKDWARATQKLTALIKEV